MVRDLTVNPVQGFKILTGYVLIKNKILFHRRNILPGFTLFHLHLPTDVLINPVENADEET